MDAARSGRGEADAEAAGELRVAAGHERGGLFMADLDESDRVLFLAERLHDAVDAVAGESEDRVDAPFLKHVDEDVCGRLSHRVLLIRCPGDRCMMQARGAA